MRTIIRGGRVLDPASSTDGIRDILVEDGIIKEVAEHISTDAENVIEAEGLYVREQQRNEQYNQYVEQVTPKANCLLNCVKAFITGGCICTVGQILTVLFLNSGMGKDEAAAYTTISLVFASVVLTGLNIYPLITTWGGAGSLVPITGFANSVVAPAIEYKKEGQVFGIGCKIFTISGPVILYGILSSWILGVIYLIVVSLRAV